MSKYSNSSKKNRLPVLIQTVSSYSQEALLTAHQLKKLSLDLICDIYISIEKDHKKFSVPHGINLIERSSGDCWSSDLDASLATLDSEYVLFWLDDFIPTSIDQHRLKSIWNWFQFVKGDYIRLNPTPKGGGSLVHDGVRIIEAGESYRASTILAIWNVKFLRSILKSGESAWQFEFSGSVRSDISNKFYACETSIIEFVNLVIKGRIEISAERKLNNIGVSTKMLDRHRMSTREYIMFNLMQMRSIIFGFIPSKLRRSLRLLFRTDLKLKN